MSLWDLVFKKIKTGQIEALDTKRVLFYGEVKYPQLWSAETPNLYDVEIEIMDSDNYYHMIKFKTGFNVKRTYSAIFKVLF